MRIREMVRQDADAVRSMLTEYLKGEQEAGAHIHMGERSLAQWMQIVGRIYDRTVSGAVLIAEEGESTLGIAIFHVYEVTVDAEWKRAAKSLLTYVRAEHRRKGIARELVATRDELAREMGAEAMLTTTRLANDAMRGVLKCAGYKPAEVTFERRLV